MSSESENQTNSSELGQDLAPVGATVGSPEEESADTMTETDITTAPETPSEMPEESEDVVSPLDSHSVTPETTSTAPQDTATLQEDSTTISPQQSSKTFDPLAGLTDNQLETFNQFKETMQQHEVLHKYLSDDLLIVKFLIARDWIPQKALEMWLNREKMVEKYDTNNLNFDSMMEAHALHGKAFVYGKGKEGHPVIIIKSQALFYHAGEQRKYNMTYDQYLDSAFRYMLYLCEESLKQPGTSPDRKVIIIYDRLLHTLGIFTILKHMKLLKTIAMLSDFYPEVLYRLIIIRHNALFQAGWKVFSTFLAKSTSEKVVLLDHMRDLQQYIDKDQLLRTMGGPGTLKPIPECAAYDYEEVPAKDEIYEEWKMYTEELMKANEITSAESNKDGEPSELPAQNENELPKVESQDPAPVESDIKNESEQ